MLPGSVLTRLLCDENAQNLVTLTLFPGCILSFVPGKGYGRDFSVMAFGQGPVSKKEEKYTYMKLLFDDSYLINNLKRELDRRYLVSIMLFFRIIFLGSRIQVQEISQSPGPCWA